jgi:PAS domain S-box-containing protein
MSILTIAWSMCGAASLMLGLMQVFLWFHHKRSQVYPLIALAAFSAAASAQLELALMHAGSTAVYAELVRWQNLVVFLILIPLVWAVYLYLGRRRRWLVWVVTLLWCVALVINFSAASSVTFTEVERLVRLPTFWGETFVGAIGVANPWVIIPDIASLLIFVFFIDASVHAWGQGRRSPAVVVGLAAASFILIGGIHTPLVDQGLVETPYMVSFAFLTMVLSLSYQLVSDSVRMTHYAREVEASRKRWHALMSGVELSVIEVDAASRIRFVNPFFEQLSGYAAEELIGRPVTSLVPEDSVQALQERLQIAAERGPRPQSYWDLLCRSGERRHMHFSTVRLEAPDGEHQGLISVGEDITDRLAVEAELTASRREMERLMRANVLGELASALAHELNQPLTAILSNAQAARRLLASNALDADELADILSDIESDDRRASAVIRRIRDMVSKSAIEHRLVDIRAVVHAAVELTRSELTTHDVRLQLALADDLPAISGSDVDLQQVVINLIMNAVRAVRAVRENAEGQRQIDITASVAGGAIAVRVADSGPGLDADMRVRIFTPFFTTKSKGIGMGLTICKRIIEAHGGQIGVEDRPGGGACFVFTLPLPAREHPDDE